MKKLIPLILLTALVGCVEETYPNSFQGCVMKEQQKLDYAPNAMVMGSIHEYCRSRGLVR